MAELARQLSAGERERRGRAEAETVSALGAAVATDAEIARTRSATTAERVAAAVALLRLSNHAAAASVRHHRPPLRTAVHPIARVEPDA